MELIFHERQEGSLCAQHCLNALLQGSFFTAVDLASISQELDEQERERMAEGGILTEEYRRFLDQPSSNMDDSGFFSVQVISKALEIWGLEMIPYGSTVSMAVEARAAPTQQRAFICNFREHWFSVRKLGIQWFNLNSINTGPELISETYLSLFLTQLQSEGYSIFIVIGSLPDCEADSVLKIAPVIQTSPTRSSRPQTNRGKTPPTDSSDMDLAMRAAMEASRNEIDDDDSSLQRAMEMSLRSAPANSTRLQFEPNVIGLDEDASLRRALALSLEASGASDAVTAATTPSASVSSLGTSSSNASIGASSSNSSVNPASVNPSLSVEDMRKKRLAFLSNKSQAQPLPSDTQTPSSNVPPMISTPSGVPNPSSPSSNAQTSNSPPPQESESDEDEQLAMAMKMSKEQ